MVVEMYQPSAVSQGPTPANPSLYNDLIRLDDLRKRGILSQEEFEKQKQKLLSGS